MQTGEAGLILFTVNIIIHPLFQTVNYIHIFCQWKHFYINNSEKKPKNKTLLCKVSYCMFWHSLGYTASADCHAEMFSLWTLDYHFLLSAQIQYTLLADMHILYTWNTCPTSDSSEWREYNLEHDKTRSRGKSWAQRCWSRGARSWHCCYLWKVRLVWFH